MELKKIKTEFIKQGFKYTQLIRTRYLAIYHQQLIKGRAEYWEVWIIRIDQARTVGESLLPKKERMPGPEDWGTFGWTFYTFEAALERYKELQQIQRYADDAESPFCDNTQPQDAKGKGERKPGIKPAIQPGLPHLVPGNNGFSLDPPL